MNKSAEAAIQRKWDSDFKIALKVHTPEPPTDELIEKYRICGTVSDAIHAWLRQREEVLSISSDSTSANLEGVTRKKSSTTETSSTGNKNSKRRNQKAIKIVMLKVLPLFYLVLLSVVIQSPKVVIRHFGMGIEGAVGRRRERKWEAGRH